uniref:Uncharacterized protein n=1 Tax=Panagrolaimus sp. JU765 TaxID=591449 RepID=A0AC34PUF2_9BILA
MNLVFGFLLLIFTFVNGQLDPSASDEPEFLPIGASQITPIRAVATFFNSSTFGFWTGTSQGTVSFFQANFPNQQPSIIDIHLLFPPADYQRKYEIEILFNGDANLRYCVDGVRLITLHKFVLRPKENFYYTSLKRYDVHVTHETESVIGRLLRIRCVNCKRRAEAMAGCAVIGRAQDEVYFDPESSINVSNDFQK